MEIPNPNIWKKCSSCKKEIPFGAKHFLCSVSTCRQKRTGLTFCSVPCWDAHLGYANHRESWAEEAIAPTKSQHAAEAPETTEVPAQEAPRSPKKLVLPTTISASPPVSSTAVDSVDTLVVVSKVKSFIKEQSDFNTSQCCVDALTKKIAQECLKAIEHARGAGRKTVMGRDVQ